MDEKRIGKRLHGTALYWHKKFHCDFDLLQEFIVICPVCNVVVERTDLVRGFELSKDNYV